MATTNTKKVLQDEFGVEMPDARRLGTNPYTIDNDYKEREIAKRLADPNYRTPSGTPEESLINAAIMNKDLKNSYYNDAWLENNRHLLEEPKPQAKAEIQREFSKPVEPVEEDAPTSELTGIIKDEPVKAASTPVKTTSAKSTSTSAITSHTTPVKTQSNANLIAEQQRLEEARKRLMDSLDYTYGRKTEESNKAYAQAIANADRELLRKGMQRTSYGQQVQANLAQQGIEAADRIQSEKLADYYNQINAMEENSANRQWQTGERLGSQEWQTGERLGSQDWQTSERLGTQAWQSSENALNRKHDIAVQKLQQEWQSGENALERAFQSSENALNRSSQSEENRLNRELSKYQSDLQNAFNYASLAQNKELTLAELAQNKELTLADLSQRLKISENELSLNRELTYAQLAQQLKISTAELAQNKELTLAQLAQSKELTLAELAQQLNISTEQLKQNKDLTLAQLAQNLEISNAEIAFKNKQLDASIEQFYKQFDYNAMSDAQKIAFNVALQAAALGNDVDDYLLGRASLTRADFNSMKQQANFNGGAGTGNPAPGSTPDWKKAGFDSEATYKAAKAIGANTPTEYLIALATRPRTQGATPYNPDLPELSEKYKKDWNTLAEDALKNRIFG